jgi:hypothetical protein
VAEGPQAALDVIRNKLQVILLRADLQQNSTQCHACVLLISDIVNELRALEAFVGDALRKNDSASH